MWLIRGHVRLTAAVLIFFMVGLSFAQTPALGGTRTRGKAAAFKYYIWGQVRSPGLHLLGPETDITELLSAAGGPSESANLSRIDIIHGIDQRIEKINLKRKLESGEIVLLSPGDIVIVHQNLTSSVRKNLILLTSFATLLNLALTIGYIANR